MSKPGRTALLVAALALASAMGFAAAAITGTMSASFTRTIGQMIGLADLRIRHQTGERLPAALLETVRNWPQTELAAAHLSLGVEATRTDASADRTFILTGIEPALETQLAPLTYLSGREVQREGELVIDEHLARKLGVVVGDELIVREGGEDATMAHLADELLGRINPFARQETRPQPRTVRLALVGIFKRSALMILQRPTGFAAVQDVRGLWGETGDLGEGGGAVIDTLAVKLRPGVDAAEVVAQYAPTMPPGVSLRATATTNQNVQRALTGMRLMVLMIVAMVLLSAAFIMTTSLTTAVTQRTRELGVLRCIGATGAQVAASQLLTGGLLALLGLLVAAPLGTWLGYVGYLTHRDILPAGFAPDRVVAGVTALMTLATGVGGAVYPAVRASRVSPTRAVAWRAQRPTRRAVGVCAVLGLPLAGFQPLLMALPLHDQAVFWVYATVGLPLMFCGYFLLSVALLMLMTRALVPLLAGMMDVPATLLRGTLRAAPFRFGFLAGAMMVGLAMLISIGTGGRSVMAGVFGRMNMPDGFIHSFFSLTPDQLEQIAATPGVQASCATTMFRVELVDLQFGIARLSPRNTMFVSFDPDAFFAMADMEWVQGEPAEALKRLKQGGAVLVSKEYLLAHGVGVGDTLRLIGGDGEPAPFEIVGVITSPGLDVAVQMFGIQDYYSDAAVSSVFGSRADARAVFGLDSANLMLLTWAPGADDEAVVRRLREQLPAAIVQSSRFVRTMIDAVAARTIGLFSAVALATLVIASLGVAQIVASNVAARRFECGVLRAGGAPRGLAGRLLLAESVVVAVTAALAGTALGVQLAAIGRLFHMRLAGLSYDLTLPWGMVGVGAAVVVVLALLATLPSVVRLWWITPRQLLAARLT